MRQEQLAVEGSTRVAVADLDRDGFSDVAVLTDDSKVT